MMQHSDNNKFYITTTTSTTKQQQQSNNLYGAAGTNFSGYKFSATVAPDLPPPSISSSKSTTVPVLFTHTLCPYAERVFLAMLEKKMPFELVHVDLSAKPKWFYQISKNGLVPVVLHNGTAHCESMDILVWLAGELPGPRLGLGLDERRVAEVMELMEIGGVVVSVGLELLRGADGRFWGLGRGQSEEQIKKFEMVLERLFAFQVREGEGGHLFPYLVGTEITLADIAVFPFLYRFSILIPHLCDFNIKTLVDGRVGRWLDQMLSRPACKISTPDEQLFSAAALKHNALDFFDYETFGVFDLHPKENEQFL